MSVKLHAHRSVLLVENVRLGRYHIGLSTDLPATRDLIHYPMYDEPMVLIRAAGGGQAARERPIICIEPSPATWRAIEPIIAREHPAILKRALIPVETFSATVQMVRAGFGDGLVPLGLARTLGIRARDYREVRGVTRHISLVTRKTVNQLASFQALQARLKREIERYFRT